MDPRLYEASLSGNVDALHALLQQDQLLLDRANSTFYEETPLHIAALCGHLDFVKSLLVVKPKLASELNASGCSALHLASVEGFNEVVDELLRVNVDVCDVPDQYGRVPLHVAVVKGRVDVVRKLVRARPEAARVRVDRGETVLHLCVKHYRLEVLRFLVEFMEDRDDDDFVRAQDGDGNTVLHVAAILKQMETLKYLLSTKSGQEMATITNASNFTALDALEHIPRDLKALEIRDFLVESKVPRSNNLKTTTTTTNNNILPPTNNNNISPSLPYLEAKLKKLWRIYRKSDTNWLEESRGNLMVVATLTATMAFQAGTSPPWNKTELMDQTKGSDLFTNDHARFLFYNTISFVASLVIILLTMSGVPLKNRFSLWILMWALCLTITFTAFTYLKSLDIITPDSDWSKVDQTYNLALGTLMVVSVFVFGVYMVRILMWLAIKVHRFVTRKYMMTPKKGNAEGISRVVSSV